MGFGEGIGEAPAFAHGGDGADYCFRYAARRDGAGSGLKRRHQGQAAGEECGQCAGKESDLIFEPDFSEDGQTDADLIKKVLAAVGEGERCV